MLAAVEAMAEADPVGPSSHASVPSITLLPQPQLAPAQAEAACWVGLQDLATTADVLARLAQALDVQVGDAPDGQREHARDDGAEG